MCQQAELQSVPADSDLRLVHAGTVTHHYGTALHCTVQPDYLSPDGSPLPRCNQEEFFQTALQKESRSQCAARYVVNPNNIYTILQVCIDLIQSGQNSWRLDEIFFFKYIV